MAELPQDDYDHLVAVAEALSPDHVAADVDKALQNAWPDAGPTVRDAFVAAASLQIGSVETSEPLPEFIDDLTRALFAQPSFKGVSQTTFRARLEPFLSMPKLSLGVRVGNVMYDNQRNFVTARTLTDIRPVFSTDDELNVERAVVVHNLRITYNESGSRGDFFVTLDDDDVASLVEILVRAQKKSDSIDKFLKHLSNSEEDEQ